MAYKKHWKNRIRGVSLIELVTSIAVLGLVSVMVVSIYFAHFKLFSNQSKTIDLANENRSALDDITNQIRESQAIVSTCSACSGDTTGATKIVLQLWPLDANGDPTDPGSSNYDYIVIKRDDLENTKLIRKILPNAASTRKSANEILSEDVSNLQFTYAPDNLTPTTASHVTVTLTNTTIEFGKTHTQTQQTQAVLRNK